MTENPIKRVINKDVNISVYSLKSVINEKLKHSAKRTASSFLCVLGEYVRRKDSRSDIADVRKN